MIELINSAGTESFGRANNMRSAHGILSYLAACGEIPEGEIVTCSQYKSGQLRVSQMEYREGKWQKIQN